MAKVRDSGLANGRPRGMGDEHWPIRQNNVPILLDRPVDKEGTRDGGNNDKDEGNLGMGRRGRQ